MTKGYHKCVLRCPKLFRSCSRAWNFNEKMWSVGCYGWPSIMSRSAALGLAVSAAVAYGYSNIFVTASWPRYGRGCIQPCPKSSWQYGENLNPVLQGGNQRSVTIQDIIMLLSKSTLLVLLCALSRVFSWLWDVLAFPAIIVVSAQKPLFTGPDEDTAC